MPFFQDHEKRDLTMKEHFFFSKYQPLLNNETLNYNSHILNEHTDTVRHMNSTNIRPLPHKVKEKWNVYDSTEINQQV